MLTSVDVGHFLIAYAAGACLIAWIRAIWRGGRGGWLAAVLAVLLVILAVAVAARSAPGENVAVQTVFEPSKGNRVQVPWIAAGACCGLLTGLALATLQRMPAAAGWGLHLAAVAALSLLTLKDEISKYLENPTATGARGIGIQSRVAAGFRVEELTPLLLAPTSLAVNEKDELFIAGYSGLALQNGVVLQVQANSATKSWDIKTVAGSLTRPHGIAFLDGALYVSRAGQFSHAVDGRLIEENTGAVTRLQDLDGDGVYDHYHDIITNLPGAQFPDGLHQNNGIAFDSRQRLYVTVGAPSDNAAFPHPLSGTIYRADADGANGEVFARGLRNPFDLAFGPEEELFCTDNDPNDTDGGDEFNHLRQGRHYGFPYAQKEGVEIEGVTEPIYRFSSAQGLVFVPKGVWPAPYDECFYVASYGNGNINRVKLTRKDDTFAAEVEFFAHVPTVIDLALDSRGVMYAVSQAERKLYRIMQDQ